jgi:Cu/Ag efflux pump CusA
MMVGGMLSATMLTLVVIPALILVWKRYAIARAVALERGIRD